MSDSWIMQGEFIYTDRASCEMVITRLQEKGRLSDDGYFITDEGETDEPPNCNVPVGEDTLSIYLPRACYEDLRWEDFEAPGMTGWLNACRISNPFSAYSVVDGQTKHRDLYLWAADNLEQPDDIEPKGHTDLIYAWREKVMAEYLEQNVGFLQQMDKLSTAASCETETGDYQLTVDQFNTITEAYRVLSLFVGLLKNSSFAEKEVERGTEAMEALDVNFPELDLKNLPMCDLALSLPDKLEGLIAAIDLEIAGYVRNGKSPSQYSVSHPTSEEREAALALLLSRRLHYNKLLILLTQAQES